MKTTVHISDFKDFPGLQDACVYFKSSMIESSFNFYVFDRVNPYDEAYRFHCDVETSNYKRALIFAVENDFSVDSVKSDLNALIASSQEVLRILISKCSYPQGHINRIY